MVQPPFLAADPPFSPFRDTNVISIPVRSIIQPCTTPTPESQRREFWRHGHQRLHRHGLEVLSVVYFAAGIAHIRDGLRVILPDVVLVRQKPGSVKGVRFITIKDETGATTLILWQDRFAAQRRLVLSAGTIARHGRMQREGRVVRVVTDLLRSVGRARRRSRSGMAATGQRIQVGSTRGSVQVPDPAAGRFGTSTSRTCGLAPELGCRGGIFAEEKQARRCRVFLLVDRQTSRQDNVEFQHNLLKTGRFILIFVFWKHGENRCSWTRSLRGAG